MSTRSRAARVAIALLAVALTLAAGLGLVAAGWTADDHDVAAAAARFAAAARVLPGVRTATAAPGLGDLGTTPVDVYGDVRLSAGCTMRDLRVTAGRLERLIGADRAHDLHPTAWCNHDGITVSPVRAVTAERLALLVLLAEDRRLTEASVTTGQRGDDPSPDRDDADVGVLLRTADPIAPTARRWSARIARRLPLATLTVTSLVAPDRPDLSWTTPGERTATLRAGDSDAVLRLAGMLDRLPHGSDWSVSTTAVSVRFATAAVAAQDSAEVLRLTPAGASADLHVNPTPP